MTPGRVNAPMPSPLPEWLTPFEPRRGLRNGHLQTIVGNYLPRPAFTIEGIAETVEVDPVDGSRVLCHCHWQSAQDSNGHSAAAAMADRLTLVLVHGLEGSSDSQYIKGIAARAWAAGCNVIRMNMRNCGGTDSLTPTLYHSGLSADVGAVVRHYTERFGLRRVGLVGYSMGGNLVLKLAGEWGSEPPLCAVAAVCPAIDLAAGSDALHEPVNRVYEWRFLRGLMARYSRKAQLFPAIYAPPGEIGRVRSLREFDDKIVARYCGLSRCGRLLLSRRQRTCRRPHRRAHADSVCPGRSFHSPHSGDPRLLRANPDINLVETTPRRTLRFSRQ